MNQGIPWSERAWTPVVGMKIKYRDIEHSKHSKDATNGYAIIKAIFPDGRLAIERHFAPAPGKRTMKYATLAEGTWKGHWEPAREPEPKPALQLTLNGHITEEDVRRIVRDELRKAFGE